MTQELRNITVLLKKDDFDLIRQYAFDKHTNMSKMIRTVIEEHLITKLKQE